MSNIVLEFICYSYYFKSASSHPMDYFSCFVKLKLRPNFSLDAFSISFLYLNFPCLRFQYYNVSSLCVFIRFWVASAGATRTASSPFDDFKGFYFAGREYGACRYRGMTSRTPPCFMGISSEGWTPRGGAA